MLGNGSKRSTAGPQVRRNLRDSSEHTLVNGEKQIRDLGAADGGLSQDVHEAEVGQVSHEGPSGVGEGEGVAPEEPLEGDDAGGHDRQPYQRQCRLSARETRVEEAVEVVSDHLGSCEKEASDVENIPNTGNHEQHEGSRRNHPCYIARLCRSSIISLTVTPS